MNRRTDLTGTDFAGLLHVRHSRLPSVDALRAARRGASRRKPHRTEWSRMLRSLADMAIFAIFIVAIGAGIVSYLAP